MIAALFCLSFTRFPVGSYGLPELCDRLHKATGAVYVLDGDLKDFAVFVSAKSGDPERVKQLVADAMRAQWKDDGQKLKLTPLKVDPNADLASFESQYRKSCAGRAAPLALPIQDLYNLAPGQMLRYGYPATGPFRPLPQAILKMAERQPEQRWTMMVNRLSKGVFEYSIDVPETSTHVFSSGGQSDFRYLPPDVEAALKPDLDQRALSAQDQQAIKAFMQNPVAIKVDWSDLAKRDPIAEISDLVLPKLAHAVHTDMAIALPDFTLFVAGMAGDAATVRGLLEPFSNVVELSMADGAVVGKLPLPTVVASAQVRRDVVSAFLAKMKGQGVPTNDAIGEYISAQRKEASESWMDVMMLVMAGTVIDEAYVGDYPFNVRLYTRLTPADWSLIRGGRQFPASSLSLNARAALIDLLLQPRSRLEADKPDPGRWASLDPANLTISAELKEEQVLIGWTGLPTEIATVSNSASMYEMRRKSLGHEPLYQPALRRNLKLTIASPADRESVESGFTEVQPDAKVKPSAWPHLPSAIAQQFKAELEGWRNRQRPPDQGVPPPVGR